MPWSVAAAGLSAAGSIGGAYLGASAAKDAASKQAYAQQQSLNWTQHTYGQTQQNLSPYINAGQAALPSILGAYGLSGGNPGGIAAAYQSFQQTPFYQFPLQQANLATNRALAASGLTGSGGQLRDLSQLNAGYASQGWGQYLGGLNAIAGSGQNAASGLGSIGVGTGAQIGQAYTNMGNAQAQGIYNGANSINQGINNALPFLTGNGQSSYGAGPAGGGGLIGQAYNSLYNPVSSLFTYGNTGGGGDSGTAALQGMGFYNPIGGGP